MKTEEHDIDIAINYEKKIRVWLIRNRKKQDKKVIEIVEQELLILKSLSLQKLVLPTEEESLINLDNLDLLEKESEKNDELLDKVVNCIEILEELTGVRGLMKS